MIVRRVGMKGKVQDVKAIRRPSLFVSAHPLLSHRTNPTMFKVLLFLFVASDLITAQSGGEGANCPAGDGDCASELCEVSSGNTLATCQARPSAEGVRCNPGLGASHCES